MHVKALVLASLIVLAPAAVAAADYDGLGHGNVPAPDEVLRIGPGHAYNIITRIRRGTYPRIVFCEYRGKWCYGSYGRYDGWVYAGPHPRDHWHRRYPAGH